MQIIKFSTKIIETNLMIVAHRSDFSVVVLFREVSCQTKVTNLQQEALRDQNIPGSQVTMDTLQSEKLI